MLENKNVIITGCARGIGKSMLELFVQNGANVWACARKQNDEFETFCSDLSDKNHCWIKPIYFDFQNTDEIKTAVKLIMSCKLPVDGLVNNAGITYNALFQMTTMDKLREVFEVNFFSQFMFMQYISKIMTKQKFGSIVNISSSAAIDGNLGKSAYGSAKAALICLTKVMAGELGEYGIRVNAIAPGITDTDMVGQSMTENVINETISQTILKRIGKPIDIANMAMYLISDKSSYLTGQTIRVDGGL